MKMPREMPRLPHGVEKHLPLMGLAAAVLVIALLSLVTTLRLVHQALAFFKEARRTMPVVRDAAILYVDERQEAFAAAAGEKQD